MLPDEVQNLILDDVEIDEIVKHLGELVLNGSEKESLLEPVLHALGKAVGSQSALTAMLSILDNYAQLTDDELYQLLIALENLLDNEALVHPQVRAALATHRTERVLRSLFIDPNAKSAEIRQRVLSRVLLATKG